MACAWPYAACASPAPKANPARWQLALPAVQLQSLLYFVLLGGVGGSYFAGKLGALEKGQQLLEARQRALEARQQALEAKEEAGPAEQEAMQEAGPAKQGAMQEAGLAELRALLCPLMSEVAYLKGAQQYQSQVLQLLVRAALGKVGRPTTRAGEGWHGAWLTRPGCCPQ